MIIQSSNDAIKMGFLLALVSEKALRGGAGGSDLEIPKAEK